MITTKDIKKILVENELEVIATNTKGEYKVVNKNGAYRIVRFKGETKYDDAKIKMQKLCFGEFEFWNLSVESFLKEFEH